MPPEPRKPLANGLWHNNPALVQILGLCPLLTTSTGAVNAILGRDDNAEKIASCN